MMAVSPSPPIVANLETVIIDGFVIETYPSIAHVPFASVSDQRGRAVKTSEHERPDELYGRCRTCMGHKSGEQLLLCDECDRGFHMTCLVPALRDVPRGEWHCPNCRRDRNQTFHARATAVVTLRNVLNDIETRPSLPPRLQLKFLDIPRPEVQFSHVPASSKSLSQLQQKICSPPRKRRTSKFFPPKCRAKPSFSLSPQPEDVEDEEPTILYKRIASSSICRQREHLLRLASALQPMAAVVDGKDIAASLQHVQYSLKYVADDHPTDEFVETRTVDDLSNQNEGTPSEDNGHQANRVRCGDQGKAVLPAEGNTVALGKHRKTFRNTDGFVPTCRKGTNAESVVP